MNIHKYKMVDDKDSLLAMALAAFCVVKVKQQTS